MGRVDFSSQGLGKEGPGGRGAGRWQDAADVHRLPHSDAILSRGASQGN